MCLTSFLMPSMTKIPNLAILQQISPGIFHEIYTFFCNFYIKIKKLLTFWTEKIELFFKINVSDYLTSNYFGGAWSGIFWSWIESIFMSASGNTGKYKGTWQPLDSKDGKYNDLEATGEDGREEPLIFKKLFLGLRYREQNSMCCGTRTMQLDTV